MAKDAQGHGSNGRGGAKPSAQGMRLIKTHVLGPHSAKVYNNPEWGEKVVQTFRNGVYQPNNDYHTDDIADAHGTAQSQLQRWSTQDATAAATLSPGGPKAAAVPVHDSMTSGRHGYNADAVNNAIASSNRSGRRIGGKEASAIHRLLKGR